MIITVVGLPVPAGSKTRNRYGAIYDSNRNLPPWREAVKWAAIEAIEAEMVAINAAPFSKWLPVLGPLCVDATFTFPRPKHHYRTGRNAHLLRDGAPVALAGKPDIDKLLRSTFDALTDAGVWRDDSQVTAVTALKVYGETAGAEITIGALE